MPSPDYPFKILDVIDELVVGPVRIEPRKLTAPYTVVQGNTVESNDLIYSYEEDVFRRDDPAARNLANMIAAQVALNYGLFCRRIVFRGNFDQHDQRFLKQMAANTCREIYVKKFLEPNPFLIGEAARLPVVKRDSYLRARLEFPDAPSTSTGDGLSPWTSEPRRCAVLSSGGKDSLLTFGLLNELGYEAHPIFGNEAGRHWFTALNAHRFFSREVPVTTRVWMNSDRMFSWMLRKLPFIRKDFANLRSDEYPIRLWTVAVFLFGALPLMRKRALGRLLIGDEYDTTWRTRFKGIPHYDGLYDQSRYFDDALSSYFAKKQWGIQQFSALRQLSEMLILKILVSRYPELQAQQVSCHAAHKEGERVHPCGKCEKCRRIVGMLLAFDADPSRCGYSAEQINHCLKELAVRGVHQESAGAEQLLWMLSGKGLIQLPADRKNSLEAHPEILKLRIDAERSPIETLPEDMRAPLLQIYRQHAQGTVRREKGRWVEVDPPRDV